MLLHIHLVLKKYTYINKDRKTAKMMKPYGLSNLRLDKKRRYSHKKSETTTNTKVSETLPIRKI